MHSKIVCPTVFVGHTIFIGRLYHKQPAKREQAPRRNHRTRLLYLLPLFSPPNIEVAVSIFISEPVRVISTALVSAWVNIERVVLPGEAHI